MNCCNCCSQFDHTHHIPRLLIFCGHSLCQVCCRQLHVNSRIQCPQCLSNTFIQQVIFLPKNLALLKVSTPLPSNNNSFCLKHQKKFQAFCKKEKMLLCVDCILHDNHRNHEMDTIKNAYLVQQTDHKETIQNIQNLLNCTQSKYQENLNNQKNFFDIHQLNCQTIMQHFHQIRQIIDRQQDSLLSKLKQNYDVAFVKFQQKNSKFLSRIQQLSVSLATLKQGNKLTEVQFLFTVHQRQQILANIGSQIQQSLKMVNISHSKNSIAQLVIKSIQKNFKISNQSIITHQGNKTPQTNPKTKKLSTHHVANNQPYQSIKQYESLQVPNQNIKPMVKKITKKEPVPVSSSLPAGIASLLGKNSSNPPLPFNKSNINSEEKKNQIASKQKSGERQKFQIGKNCDISIVEQKQSLFNSFFSNMTSFLTEHKYIYVIGGFDEQTSNIVKFNLNNFKWEQVSSLKAPWSKFGCVTVDKSIFIMGGKKGRQRVADIQVWNNGNWNSSQYTLKKKRSGFGIIAYQNFIYVIGGNDGENILNSMEILNVLTGEWMKAQPMQETRDQLAVCLGKDQKIYAIGGFGGKNNQPLKSVQMYDIRAQKWYKVPSLNIQRRALAAASLADGIYAIGGFDGTKHLNSVQKYEEGSSSWVKIADLKRGRCTHSATSVFDTQEIIVMGGFDEQALDSVQKYSLISNQWQQITKMPVPRFMHSCVLLTE